MTEEHRRNPRVLLDVAVDIAQGNDQNVSTGRARDISLGGMFVTCTLHASFGTTVTVRFRIPGSDHELALSGVVRWKRDDGVGVQFLACGVRETHAITEWVRRARASAPQSD